MNLFSVTKKETRAHVTITFTAWGQPKIIIDYGLPSQRSSSLVSLRQPRPQASARYPCVRRKLGTKRHLDNFSRQAWRVTSHPKLPRTTGNQAEPSVSWVMLSCYDIFALFGSKFCFDWSACKLARAYNCTFIMRR